MTSWRLVSCLPLGVVQPDTWQSPFNNLDVPTTPFDTTVPSPSTRCYFLAEICLENCRSRVRSLPGSRIRNSNFSHGTFWFSTFVTLPKKPSAECCEEYRTITLEPCPCPSLPQNNQWKNLSRKLDGHDRATLHDASSSGKMLGHEMCKHEND